MPTVPAAHVRISGLAVAGPTGHASPTVIPWTRVGQITRLLSDARAEVRTGRVRILGGGRAYDLAQQLQLRALARDLRNDNARWRWPASNWRRNRCRRIARIAPIAMGVILAVMPVGALAGTFIINAAEDAGRTVHPPLESVGPPVFYALIASVFAWFTVFETSRHRLAARGKTLLARRRRNLAPERLRPASANPLHGNNLSRWSDNQLPLQIWLWSRYGRRDWIGRRVFRTWEGIAAVIFSLMCAWAVWDQGVNAIYPGSSSLLIYLFFLLPIAAILYVWLGSRSGHADRDCSDRAAPLTPSRRRLRAAIRATFITATMLSGILGLAAVTLNLLSGPTHPATIGVFIGALVFCVLFNGLSSYIDGAYGPKAEFT